MDVVFFKKFEDFFGNFKFLFYGWIWIGWVWKCYYCVFVEFFEFFFKFGEKIFFSFYVEGVGNVVGYVVVNVCMVVIGVRVEGVFEGVGIEGVFLGVEWFYVYGFYLERYLKK